MLLYTSQESIRLRYTIDFLNDHFLKDELIITANLDLFMAHEGVKINYSNKELANTYNVVPEGLLFEDNIRIELPSLLIDEQDPILFKEDRLSSIFYFLSRYEEYQIEDRDQHNRFLAKHSIAAKAGLLGRPIVDIWANEFVNEIESNFGVEVSKQRNFSFLCTFDIDVAYAFKGRSRWRRNAVLFKNLLNGNSSFLKERNQVLSGKRDDPYDTYQFQKELILKHDLDAIYFFHLGNWAKFDRQIQHNSKEMKDLIEFVSGYARVGIHPSYKASDHLKLIEQERHRLEFITGEICLRSRMHYLRMDLPMTYHLLMQLGIKEDYTMGYADSPGFRAGTSLPFKFFDLKSNQKLDIMLYPLCVMESSFIYYLDTSPNESNVYIKSIIDEVKKVNGNFISLWHNHSLGNNGQWKDWRNLFVEMIEYI